MTMIEKLRAEHPEFIGEQFPGGVAICPCDVGYEDFTNCTLKQVDITEATTRICRECWERELRGA